MSWFLPSDQRRMVLKIIPTDFPVVWGVFKGILSLSDLLWRWLELLRLEILNIEDVQYVQSEILLLWGNTWDRQTGMQKNTTVSLISIKLPGSQKWWTNLFICGNKSVDTSCPVKHTTAKGESWTKTASPDVPGSFMLLTQVYAVATLEWPTLLEAPNSFLLACPHFCTQMLQGSAN